MTESHIRVNVNANWIALQSLECAAYKVLMGLAGRADSLGICFPGRDKIADDTALHVQTVDAALKTLAMEGYIKYLRKNAYDPVLRRSMPNVYQVSPQFLAISDSCLVQAMAIWEGGTESISYTNQQQNYVPEQSTKESIPETTTTTNNNSEKQGQTANREKPKTTAQPQRSEKSKNSAIVKKYTNPISIIEPLPDELSEQLAQRINGYKIPIGLARGFVFKYGYSDCDKAANYFEFCRTFQEIKSSGGFYRDILEHKLADENVSVDAPKDYTGGEFSDFVEH